CSSFFFFCRAGDGFCCKRGTAVRTGACPFFSRGGGPPPAALHGSAGELSWGARELSPRWRRALRTADSSRRLARDARRDRTGHHPGECDRRPWAEETIVGQARRSLERPHRLREPSIVEMRKRHLEVA